MAPAPHVVVCGAGLTGLTTAWHLRQAGCDVTVLEATDRVGGVMQTTRQDGYLVEHGPNSCMLTEGLATLVDAVGLTPLLRPAAPQAQRRYIVRDSVAHAVPSSPLALLTSPLISTTAKLRVLAEPFIARRTATTDESVADFVRRRLGHEVLTWAVDPFVSGVYAGDPALLSVRHAFPRLAALEREHGSLIRGAIAAGGKRRVAPQNSALGMPRGTMVSFVDGMGTLPQALADYIGTANILRRARVVGVTTDRGHPIVTVERDGVTFDLHADAVISTLPLHALAQLQLGNAADTALASLASVPYPPVVSLALGYRREDVTHPLDGFGCLVPSAEQRNVLGILFSSTLFPARAPDGHVLLTCFLGGTRRPALAACTAAQLTELIAPELATLLGVSGAPSFVQCTTWPQAIPQYNVGHDTAGAAADAIEAVVPGMLVDGQFRRGVSVGDCIAAGGMIAGRAVAIARAATARPRVATPASAAAIA